MYENTYVRFRGGCMMLLRRDGDVVTFVGTATLVHPEGYLLTAAHLLGGNHENLLVAPWDGGIDFVPIKANTVAPLRAEVKATDGDHDLALLGFHRDMDITMPDHVAGAPHEVSPGTSVACLGYPFGYFHIYNQYIYHAIVNAKIESRNGTQLFVFDVATYQGMRGGPLISAHDGRVIGIVGGRFHPEELLPGGPPEGKVTESGLSYAISIEYGATLLEAQGVEAV